MFRNMFPKINIKRIISLKPHSTLHIRYKVYAYTQSCSSCLYVNESLSPKLPFLWGSTPSFPLSLKHKEVENWNIYVHICVKAIHNYAVYIHIYNMILQ